MAQGINTHIRKRRMQRWLRREALLLAREAERLDCADATREAARLVDIAEGRAGLIFAS